LPRAAKTLALPLIPNPARGAYSASQTTYQISEGELLRGGRRGKEGIEGVKEREGGKEVHNLRKTAPIIRWLVTD